MRSTVILTIASVGQAGGPCAWCATLTSKGKRLELTGGSVQSTQPRQLWRALIEGLNSLTRPCVVLAYTNAAWLVSVMTNRPEDTSRSDDLYREARAAALEHRLEMHHRAEVGTQRDGARKMLKRSDALGDADMPTEWVYEQADDAQMGLF